MANKVLGIMCIVLVFAAFGLSFMAGEATEEKGKKATGLTFAGIIACILLWIVASFWGWSYNF